MMGWIKVEDRLPKSGERILIYWTHRGKQVPDIIDYESDAFELLQSVTHWMPITPPGSDEPALADGEREAMRERIMNHVMEVADEIWHELEAADGEREAVELIQSLSAALRFARSVIKCGEPWDGECDRVISGAITDAYEHVRARQLQERE